MSRALLTEKERDALSGKLADQNQKSTYKARVKNRIEERLADDLEIIATHHPELFKQIQKMVDEESSVGKT